MVNILVVQSRTTESRIERERENFRRSIGENVSVSFLSALDERLAWTTPEEFLDGFHGVIFGGSSDFDFHGGRYEDDPARVMSFLILSRTRNIVSYARSIRLPLLGICFGHQLIANMHGGDVANDKQQSKFGLHEVALTQEGKKDPVFKHLPERFTAVYAHKDSVTQMPEGATLLAQANDCKFSALRYGANAYTVQFHPEVRSFNENPPEDANVPEASRIIPLWIEHVVSANPA